MVTIILTVSRPEFLEKVITGLELQDCKAEDTNLLCIVDGDDTLFIKARNLVNGSRFNERLTVKADVPGKPVKLDVKVRRKRISAIHNQARALIKHDTGYVLSVEDDTLFGLYALQRLLKIATTERAFAMAEGVELGRWGVPYVGAWIADDIYDMKTLTSIPNDRTIRNIDAGGLYCALIRADLYKQHTFHSENGLGPDINFGLECRQLGFQNFIAWDVPCKHLFMKSGQEQFLSLSTQEPTVVTLTKQNESKWAVSY